MAEVSADLGAFLGGMIKSEQAINNRLTDSHLDEAIMWAKRFKYLYDAVQEHNRDMYVADVLWDMGHHYDDIPRKIAHYEGMKMSGEG